MINRLCRMLLVSMGFGFFLSLSCILCHHGYVIAGLLAASALGAVAVVALRYDSPVLLENFFSLESWVTAPSLPPHPVALMVLLNDCLIGRLPGLVAGFIGGLTAAGILAVLPIIAVVTAFNLSMLACIAFHLRAKTSDKTVVKVYRVDDRDLDDDDAQTEAWFQLAELELTACTAHKRLGLNDISWAQERLNGDPLVQPGERAFVFVKEFWMDNGQCVRIAQIARGFQSLAALRKNFRNAANLQCPR